MTCPVCLLWGGGGIGGWGWGEKLPRLSLLIFDEHSEILSLRMLIGCTVMSKELQMQLRCQALSIMSAFFVDHCSHEVFCPRGIGSPLAFSISVPPLLLLLPCYNACPFCVLEEVLGSSSQCGGRRGCHKG